MDAALYYKCDGCGYEFLSKKGEAACPRCKSRKLTAKDVKAVGGIDE